MNGATNKQLEQLNSVREALFSQVRHQIGFGLWIESFVLDPDPQHCSASFCLDWFWYNSYKAYFFWQKLLVCAAFDNLD